MKFHIPIKLPSLLNQRLHWRRAIAMKKLQKTATWVATLGLPIPPPPITITITRLGPRRLDDDNLAGACKYVRDQIAAQIGVDDGSDQYTWVYKQEISNIYGVDVEIISR